MGLDVHANYFYNDDDNIIYEDDIKNQKKWKQKEPLITILGQTQPVPSLHGTRVTPIIGAINYDLPNCTSTEFTTLFPSNPDEVDYIFTIPLEYLLANETSAPLQRWNNYDGKAEAMGPVFAIPDEYTQKKEGDRIWGFTAIILRALLKKVFRPVFGQDGLKVI
jgi:DNA modification methylase